VLLTIILLVRGNSAAARLRYKWWLDTLRNIYSNISNDINDSSSNAILNNPVLYCLYSSIKENDLSHRWLECVIEAKMNELNSIQHGDLAELEDHCEKSHSSLLYLLLESMGIRHEQTEYMASHIGVCFGIVSHLRGTAYFLSQVQLVFKKTTNSTLMRFFVPVLFFRTSPPFLQKQ
jgi:NADH dehydrogenase [ubiquinone] 1 alpha subcomplex assembly factor 6